MNLFTSASQITHPEVYKITKVQENKFSKFYYTSPFSHHLIQLFEYKSKIFNKSKTNYQTRNHIIITWFVSFDLSSESGMVGNIINFSLDSPGIGESVASLYGMTTVAFFLTVLLSVFVLDVISKFVRLGCMVSDRLQKDSF